MVCRRAVGLLVALLFIPASSGAAPSARAELERFVERAKEVLGNATDVERTRGEFRVLTHELFDGRAAARHALGAEWDKRTPAAREEFARSFSDLLERAYLEIVQGQLPRDRVPEVLVVGEQPIGKRGAVVSTRVRARDGRDVRMDYAMAPAGRRWRVHDVAIEGVSLVENYRAQFARVLRDGSYPALLDRVQAAAGPARPVLAEVSVPPGL